MASYYDIEENNGSWLAVKSGNQSAYWLVPAHTCHKVNPIKSCNANNFQK